MLNRKISHHSNIKLHKATRQGLKQKRIFKPCALKSSLGFLCFVIVVVVTGKERINRIILMQDNNKNMGNIRKNTEERKIFDKAGDSIFVAYKSDNGQIITGYFTLMDDLDQQFNFLRIKTGKNILMIPHSQILKIKIKEVDDGN